MIDRSLCRSLFIDMTNGEPGPKRGDYIQAVGRRGPGARYRVWFSRRVKRHDPAAVPRYTMLVERVDEIPPTAKTVFEFHWYPRTTRSVPFEQYMKRLKSPHP